MMTSVRKRDSLSCIFTSASQASQRSLHFIEDLDHTIRTKVRDFLEYDSIRPVGTKREPQVEYTSKKNEIE